jgi:tRNA(Met) C34 N-acetyltransferase TmcA
MYLLLQVEGWLHRLLCLDATYDMYPPPHMTCILLLQVPVTQRRAEALDYLGVSFGITAGIYIYIYIYIWECPLASQQVLLMCC